MSEECWIVIPKWEQFQHYADRDPPWIKLYTELNSNDDWYGLSVAERGLLCTIWVEYARSRGQISTQRVRGLCRGSARTSHFEALNHAGFIHFSASKPLALARSRDLQKAEKNKKKGQASSDSREPEQRHAPVRQNAAAYHKHQPEPQSSEPVQLDEIQAYLAQLERSIEGS